MIILRLINHNIIITIIIIIISVLKQPYKKGGLALQSQIGLGENQVKKPREKA